jgi:predicted acetyltransferase
MLDEFRAAGEPYHGKYQEPARNDMPSLLARWDAQSRAVDLEPGHAAVSFFWLVDAADRVVGSARLRHWISEQLFRCGGHIGYDIRPSARRRGYAKRLCAMMLNRARARGIVRALLTCDADNAASRRVIEANGGRLHSRVRNRRGKDHLRFWVDLF